MKVLFAVSNEEISENIVKKYRNQYKEILSYKNVYYFNAILKELQKDKTYDRIIISEDLEKFTHNQYGQIDKFIFDKLDSISDEASNVRGNDIPIILICSDRRTKSEQMLVKLFGIGIYNALLGTDRSVDKLCELIYKPRLKKEAKSYYEIDTDDVKYKAENENDVSEVEIQNILAHYKRLGKNEEKYLESFDNIATQYNDQQLRVICKFLPLNVRAVLEEKSPKYQKIISFNAKVSDKIRKPNNEKEISGTSEKLLRTSHTAEKILSKPVVIPNAVNLQQNKKMSKLKQSQQSINLNKDDMNSYTNTQDTFVKQQLPNMANEQQMKRQTIMEKQIQQSMEPLQSNQMKTIDQEEQKERNEEQPVKRGRGRPRKNPVPNPTEIGQEPVKKKRGRPRKNPPIEEQMIAQEPTQIVQNNDFERLINEETEQQQFEGNIGTSELNMQNDTILPGFDDINEQEEVTLPGFDNIQEETVFPGFEDENNEDDMIMPGFEDTNVQKNDMTANLEFNELELEKQYSGFEDNREANTLNNNGFNNQFDSSALGYGVQDINQNNMQQTISNPYDNNMYNNFEVDTTIDISPLLAQGKKVACFVGTSKNGTSFVVNNVAEILSSAGVSTAILDTTQNRNSYYIYTKSEEELRNTAIKSLENLVSGSARGLQVNKNLAVYTSLPGDNDYIYKAGEILQTLAQNYSVILIDCDFQTPISYFAYAQEIYLVQSLDVLTIQPLTAFLNELKARNVLQENKLRIVLNKVEKLKGISDKIIIGGMSSYNDPAMSYMTELFDKNLIKYIAIPFDEQVYVKYLEGLINCELSLKGYPKNIIQILTELGNMIYPINSGKSTYKPPTAKKNGFTPNINSTLEQMRKY